MSLPCRKKACLAKPAQGFWKCEGCGATDCICTMPPIKERRWLCNVCKAESTTAPQWWCACNRYNNFWERECMECGALRPAEMAGSLGPLIRLLEAASR